MAIWRMRIACWITEATDPHSEYVLNISFPLQQMLQEHAAILSYTYIAWFLAVFREILIYD